MSLSVVNVVVVDVASEPTDDDDTVNGVDIVSDDANDDDGDERFLASSSVSTNVKMSFHTSSASDATSADA